MAPFRVTVEPAVLAWARGFASMSPEQVAAKLDQHVATILAWEAGADELAQPTQAQLRDLARLYKVPLPTFYLSEPPGVERGKVPDFRHRGGDRRQAWSTELYTAFRRVEMQRSVAVELATEIDEVPSPLSLKVSVEDGPERVGAAIRVWLGVSIDEQNAWRQDYSAVNGWSAAIEARDILVAQVRRVEPTEMLGFAIGEEPFPIIAVNGAQKPRPKVFTLIHELVHVLLRSSSLCDLRERPSTDGSDNIELFCNAAAGATLLPRWAMEAELEMFGVGDSPVVWLDSDLATIANRYHVSREVVLRRMVSLGRATLDDYFRRLNVYRLQYLQEDEEENLKDKRDGGGGMRMRLVDMGRRYTGDVLSAYERRDIDAHELTLYLGTKIDSIPKLEALLGR